jgi:N utilization substance protein B
MLNRRHIRIKILQLLYSKTTGKIDNKSLLKHFELSTQNFYKFFLTQIILFKEIFNESNRFVDLNEKKYFKKDSKKIKKLFSENTLLKSLDSDKFLIKALEKYELNYWTNNSNKVQNIFKEILNSEFFVDYSKDQNFFIQDVYKNLIASNDELFDFYEDCEIGWVDDFPLVNTIVLNWLINSSINSTTLIPTKVFKDRSDKKFGKELFKIAVKDDKNIQELINEYTPEWDNDRIAVIDMIILKMCINEFTSFPSIPVKVSINEYVEISKQYSSPNSSTFINGVLNNIYRKLDKEGMINKNERGSQ